MQESVVFRPRNDAVGTVPAAAAREPVVARYRRVREATLDLVARLVAEDTVIQSMPDASPTKWHLAHTTWFFEQFVLGREPRCKPLHPDWQFLFNSYYQSIGPMHARADRGRLSRPTLAEIMDYRARVDERVADLLSRSDDAEVESLLTLGLNHEQQHQELLLTDIKHLFSLNPLQPVYRPWPSAPTAPSPLALAFIRGVDGIVETGHGGDGFAFDCETPRHRTLLYPHALANRLVTNAEYREFIRDHGYCTPTLWMAEGWNSVEREDWQHPLYWSDDLESEFTLAGTSAIDPQAPVSHVSFFEADAFARWAGVRLPSEDEWESLAATQPCSGNLAGSGRFHPLPATPGPGPRQLFGDVWEWTASPYVSYPGYRPPAGALGEYNGKFMCGQYVLRGGSCVTPDDHVRATYRNFFAPAQRWQFMGFRLGRDA